MTFAGQPNVRIQPTTGWSAAPALAWPAHAVAPLSLSGSTRGRCRWRCGVRMVGARAQRSRMVLAACAAAVVLAALFAGAGLATGVGSTDHTPDAKTSTVRDIAR